MVITIKKSDTQKEVKAAVKRLSKKTQKPGLSDFYGKLKGKFGDGLNYQKEIRNDWD